MKKKERMVQIVFWWNLWYNLKSTIKEITDGIKEWNIFKEVETLDKTILVVNVTNALSMYEYDKEIEINKKLKEELE